MRRCVSFKEVEHDFKPSFPIRLARPIGAVGSFAMRPQEGVVMLREFEVRHAPPEFDLLKTHLTESERAYQVTHPSDHAKRRRKWRRTGSPDGSNKSCS